MASPIDYLGAMGGLGPDYLESVLGQQQVRQNRNILAQQVAAAKAAEIAQLRAQQKQADLNAVLTNPTADGFARIQALYPEDREAFKSAWETRSEDVRQADLRELSGLHGYLQNGMPDKAIAALDRRIAADKAAGLDTAEDEEVRDAIQTDPQRAAGVVAFMLSSIVPPDQFAATLKNVGEDVRAEEVQPSAIRKAAAEAGKLEAEEAYAPQVIESDLASEAATRARQAAQTAIEQANLDLGWERLNLDKDALATNTQLKLEEMLATGSEVKGASLTELTSAVGSAQQNEALAERTSTLADEMAASDMRGAGWRSWFGEQYAGAFGSQDAVTGLRAQYEQLKISQAIKSLPPGPASDKDVKLAMSGFPPADADKDYLVSWLRGMAKMQKVAASADQRRADWISSNGNLGTSKRDLNVGGVMVPAGTTFAEFNKIARKTATKDDLPKRAYLEKYGGGGGVPAPPAALRKR